MNAPQMRTPRTCERDGCGRVFTPKRDARYCSDTCRAQASRASRMRSETKQAVSERREIIAAPLVWDPPSEPRTPCQTTDPCPECGAPLVAEPRGIWHACLACGTLVTPPGVTAPYAAGTARQRQVKSQRDRDADARALEARRQRLADELDTLTADKRLTSEARGTLKWYRAEVDKAADMARLDDLVEQARSERLPRAGWFSRPAAAEIEPPDYDDDDWEDGDEAQADDPAAPPAAPPPGRRMTWREAITALGWRLLPAGNGCQLLADGRPCAGPADRDIGSAWVCGAHYGSLGAVIWRDYDQRSAS